MIKTRLATIQDLDSIAPLFDAYRQFYKQKSDLKLAKKFISERLKNNIKSKSFHESLGYIIDQGYDARSLKLI